MLLALVRDRKSETKLRKLFIRFSKSLSLEFDLEKRLLLDEMDGPAVGGRKEEALGTEVTPSGSRKVLDGS